MHVNESTGFAPFELIYGWLPLPALDSSLNYSEQEIKKNFTVALTVIQDQIGNGQRQYKF